MLQEQNSSSAEVAVAVGIGGWYCHCCRAYNAAGTSTCGTCGRSVDWVRTTVLPLHDEGVVAMRTNQLDQLLDATTIHQTDSEKWTALHCATLAGNISVVQHLLGLGARIDATTTHGWQPLHCAAMNGFVDLLELLLRHGADVNAVTKFEQLTPLHLAVRHKHTAAMMLLIDHGADTLRVDALGRNVLHMAAEGGDAVLGEALISRLGDAVDLNAATVDGWTAIHYAMLGGHKEFEQLLMIHNHHRTESTFDYDLSKQMLEAFTGSKTWVKAKTRLHQQSREFDATEHKQEILQRELQEAQRRMETRRSESGVEPRTVSIQAS